MGFDIYSMGFSPNEVGAVRSQVSLMKLERDLKSKADSLIYRLSREIDKIPQMEGAGICYVDSNDNVYKLREYVGVGRSNPIYIVLRQPPGSIKINDFEAYIKQNKASPREAQLNEELKGLGYNCTGMVLGWIAVGVSGIGTVTTFGMTSIVFVLSVSAAVAGTIQCVGSGLRTWDMSYKDGHITSQLDSSEWYKNTMKVLEVTTLLSAAAAGKGLLLSLKNDWIVHGSQFVKNRLIKLSIRERKGVSTQIANLQDITTPNIGYFSNLVKGPFANTVRTKAIFDKTVITQVVDAVGSAVTVKGSIETGGLLNINKPNGFSVGILGGLDNE